MRTVPAIVLAGVLVLAADASGQKCSFCQITPEEVTSFDTALTLTEAEQQTAEETHLPFGIPEATAATNEHLLHQEHFVLNYDDDLRVPLWAAYRLRKSEICRRDRKNCFRRDPRLSDEQAAFCEDYEEPVFDRGHLAPRAAMNRSKNAMLNTYVLTNMAPVGSKNSADMSGVLIYGLAETAFFWSQRVDSAWHC